MPNSNESIVSLQIIFSTTYLYLAQRFLKEKKVSLFCLFHAQLIGILESKNSEFLLTVVEKQGLRS